jgi:hypothetical protein
MKNNSGVAWSPILGQGNFHKASRFGRVTWVDPSLAPPAPAGSTAVTGAITPAGSASTMMLRHPPMMVAPKRPHP